MPRTFVNRDAVPFVVDAAPSRAALEFHRRLPGYEVSALTETPAIAAELGLGRVWVKEETRRLDLPSFKILGASWGVYRTLEQLMGGLEPWASIDELAEQLDPLRPMSLTAATDGNHGRAVARMAALLGFGALIFVPEGTSSARIEGIEAEGATCEAVAGTYEDAVARAAREASDRCLLISDTSWEGYEEVPRWIIEGYSTIFNEVDDELGADAPDLVVVQIGVGALAASAVRHFRGRPDVGDPPRLVGVEPDRAACVLASMEAGELVTIPGPHDSIMAGLNCGTPSLVAWPIMRRGFDAFVAAADERAEDAMRALAREGIVAGETGAAGLAGLVELLRGTGAEAARALGVGPEARVLLICTEGATDPAAYERIVGAAP